MAQNNTVFQRHLRLTYDNANNKYEINNYPSGTTEGQLGYIRQICNLRKIHATTTCCVVLDH